MADVVFGCDPEFVVRNPEGEVVPAHLFFPPPKEKVLVDDSWNSGIAGYFRDGFNLEVNATPRVCCAQMLESVRSVLIEAQRKLPKGYKLDAVSAVEVDPQVASGDGAPADAKTFGCNPSLNAYTGGADSPPIDAISHPMRYAGGHIHFSTGKLPPPFPTGYRDVAATRAWQEGMKNGEWDAGASPRTQWLLNPDNHPMAVKLMDREIGLPLTVLQKDIPEVFARRMFYGRAGEFRTQKYKPLTMGKGLYAEKSPARVGIEYRVPGSEMWRSHFIATIFIRTGRKVIRNFAEMANSWDKSIEDDLVLAINEGTRASSLLKKLDPKVYEVMKAFRDVPETQTFSFTAPGAEFHTGFEEKQKKWGIETRLSGLQDYDDGEDYFEDDYEDDYDDGDADY